MRARTTIVMEEELLRAVREVAGTKGWSLSRAIAELVLGGMQRTQSQKRGKKFRLEWVTSPGKALPGVDIDDRDRLYDIMEGRS